MIAHEEGIHKEVLDLMVPGIGIMMDNITKVIITDMMIQKDMAEKHQDMVIVQIDILTVQAGVILVQAEIIYTGKSDDSNWRSRSNEQPRNYRSSSPGQSPSRSFRDVKSTPPRGYSDNLR